MKFTFKPVEEQTLVERLRNRATIRMNNTDRKSVQNNEPDRISALLIEAADEIDKLNNCIGKMDEIVHGQEEKLQGYLQASTRRGKSILQSLLKELTLKQSRQIFSSESEAPLLYKNICNDKTGRYEYIESESGSGQFTGGYSSEVFIDTTEKLKYEFEFDNSDEPHVVNWYKVSNDY